MLNSVLSAAISNSYSINVPPAVKISRQPPSFAPAAGMQWKKRLNPNPVLIAVMKIFLIPPTVTNAEKRCEDKHSPDLDILY